MVEPYSVDFRPDAQKELRSLSKWPAQRVISKIKWLSANFDAVSHEGLKGEFKQLFKLRIGDYRVLYSFRKDKRLIVIHSIGHRRGIYEHR